MWVHEGQPCDPGLSWSCLSTLVRPSVRAAVARLNAALGLVEPTESMRAIAQMSVGGGAVIVAELRGEAPTGHRATVKFRPDRRRRALQSWGPCIVLVAFRGSSRAPRVRVIAALSV